MGFGGAEAGLLRPLMSTETVGFVVSEGGNEAAFGLCTCVSEWRLRFSVWRRVKGGAIRVWWNHFVVLTVTTVECCFVRYGVVTAVSRYRVGYVIMEC